MTKHDYNNALQIIRILKLKLRKNLSLSDADWLKMQRAINTIVN